MAAFKIRSVEVRTVPLVGQVEHAPTVREAMGQSWAVVRVSSLAQDLVRDPRMIEEAGLRFASSRALYDELRTRGRFYDLHRERASRVLRVFGATLLLDVIHVRSQGWASDEWIAMAEHLGPDGVHPVKDPGVRVAPVCEAAARRLQWILQVVTSHQPGEPVGEDGYPRAFTPDVRAALEEANAWAWVHPWFWRAPEGTWGRAAAALWRAQGLKL